MSFFSTLLFIILLVWIIRLSGRVTQLEQKLGLGPKDTTASTPAPSQAPSPTAAPESAAPPPPPPSAPHAYPPIVPEVQQPQAAPESEGPVPTPPVYAPTPVARVHTVQAATGPQPDPFKWFKEHTLIKIGAFIFFLGAVWFVSYAINEGWISPVMRIYFGIALGLGVQVAGFIFQRRSRQQYLVLTMLGSGIIIASVYAGQFLFGVFAPLFAMLILLLVIVYTVFTSVRANAQWLCVLSAIAGLIAPLLINSPEPQALNFFLYLFVLSGGFMAVVLKTKWRAVTLTLLFGFILFMLSFMGNQYIEDNLAWFFTVIFSTLFFVGTSLSLYRTKEPNSADLTTLGVTSVYFLAMAGDVALVPELAAFASTLVVAGVGYFFYLQGLPQRVQGVYAGIAILHLFVATAFLLDGFSLTIAYAIEVALIVSLTLYLKLGEKAVTVSSALILIPIATSFESMASSVWRDGIWHTDSAALWTMVFTILGTALWALKLVRAGYPEWYLKITGLYGTIGYIYLMILTGLINDALFTVKATSEVSTYVTWTVLSLVFFMVLISAGLPGQWRRWFLVSLMPPALASLQSFTSRTWDEGIVNVDAFGLLMMTVVFLGLAALHLRQYFAAKQAVDQSLAGFFLGTFWLYAVALIGVATGSVFAEADTANTVRMVLWAFISYLMVNILFRLPVPAHWVVTALSSLGLPSFVALALALNDRWTDGPLSVVPIGLYFMTTIFCILGITLHRQLPDYQGDKKVLEPMIKLLFVVGALLAIRLVWLITHSIFASDDYAVTVALFIYTVVGLVCYRLGSLRGQKDVKLGGIILLSLVVIRLLLIEVWVMDTFWRIITFLGVGALFIVTALVERKENLDGPDDQNKNQVTPPPPPPSSEAPPTV